MKDLKTLRIEGLSKEYNHRIADFNHYNYEHPAKEKQDALIVKAGLLNKKINTLIVKKNAGMATEEGVIPEHAVFMMCPSTVNDTLETCAIVLKNIKFNSQMKKNESLSILTAEIIDSFAKTFKTGDKFNTQQFIEEINAKHPGLGVESIDKLTFFDVNNDMKYGRHYHAALDISRSDATVYGLSAFDHTKHYVENEQVSNVTL